MVRTTLLVALLSWLLVACQSGEQPSPDTSDHSHENGDHTHGEEASVVHTVWTDEVELFVEYKAFVVGELSRFAAHFTRLSDYKPFTEGTVTVSLIKSNKGIRHTVDAPARPGIFMPALQPKEAGIYQLVFELNAQGISERIVLDSIPVFETMADAVAALGTGEEDSGTISFLKEQAWKIDFAVQKANYAPIGEVIRVAGEVLPSQGDERTVAAPSSGIIITNVQKIQPSRAISKGDWLYTIVPTGDPDENLEARLKEAQARYDQAKSEYERQQGLLEDKIISAKEFERTQMEYKVAQVALENITKYVSQGGVRVYAPISGYVQAIHLDPGAFAETGTPLLTLAQNRRVQLVADVPQQYFPQLRQVRTADFKTTYSERVHSLSEYNGRLVSYARSISLDEPFIPIYFELDNRGELLPGSMVELYLKTNQTQNTLVITRSALLEEYGNYFVMVQLGGETFEKRQVEIGIDNGVEVQVLRGLKPGEIVVTVGAYQVKMASMAASAPAHGHPH